MIDLNSDSEVRKLSQSFYNAYPNPPYKEILYNKNGRAYNCILFDAHDYFICIPYRTNINHKYAYHFKNTVRSKTHHSGLDYQKIVIIKDPTYIDTKNIAIVDNDEYTETMVNIKRIKSEALQFVEDYIGYVNGSSTLSSKEYSRRYLFSPLQYFHKELGII